MSQIVLFLPGNLYHSNISQPDLERMWDEKAGMDILRQSNIPIIFAWQWIDELLAPEIYDAGPHELGAGPWTHALLNRMHPQDAAQQMKEKRGQLDVTFCPEFAPLANLEALQTEYFFLSRSHTKYYHHDIVTRAFKVAPGLPDGPSIRVGTKVGILINTSREKIPLRNEWHKYQETSSSEELAALVQAVESVAASPESRVQIALWDLETPYVGSRINANQLWEQFFEALDKRALTSAFSRLEPHLPWFKEQALESYPPHRSLVKWTQHDVQLDYLQRAYDGFEAGWLSERGQWLLAIARTSDILSAMDSRIQAQGGDPNIPSVKWREEVIQTGFACLDILEGKASLETLAEIDPLLGPRLVEILQQKVSD